MGVGYYGEVLKNGQPWLKIECERSLDCTYPVVKITIDHVTGSTVTFLCLDAAQDLAVHLKHASEI